MSGVGSLHVCDWPTPAYASALIVNPGLGPSLHPKPDRVQLLEWWYTQAEDKMGGQAVLPPPPPPPAPRPHPDGVPLPDDPAVCPLCQQVRMPGLWESISEDT
jgi:hypothetical protein